MSSRKRRKFLTLASVALAVLLFVTLNSLLPRPLLPALTWDAFLDRSGVVHPTTLPGGELEVHFIDVGNADAILVRTEGNNMLIDAGEPGDGDDVVDYLQSQGVDDLDLVIATHPDSDHIGGMADVLTAFPVEKMVMSFMEDEHTPTTRTYENMLLAIDEQNIAIEEAVPGTQYQLGEARVDILAPLMPDDETNNMSVVSRITFGEHRFLMMGDAEEKVEKALLKAGVDLSATVLKAGHHGSHSSTGEEFLQAVSPTYAFIPCGADNRYGHPHPETLGKLQQAGVEVYRADVNGTVVMHTDGGELQIQTEEDAA